MLSTSQSPVQPYYFGALRVSQLSDEMGGKLRDGRKREKRITILTKKLSLVVFLKPYLAIHRETQSMLQSR